MQCAYCSSRIFETDRVCPRCGAPNIILFTRPEKEDSYGMWLRDIESQPVTPFVSSGSTVPVRNFSRAISGSMVASGYFERCIREPLNSFLMNRVEGEE